MAVISNELKDAILMPRNLLNINLAKALKQVEIMEEEYMEVIGESIKNLPADINSFWSRK